MKKVSIFIAILAAIVLLHLLVIKLFFSDNKANEKNKKAATAELKAGKKAGKPVENTAAAAVKTEPRPEPVKVVPKFKFKTISKNPNFGRYFTYRNAVWNKINTIPECIDARSGILVDLGTRNVLWAKKPRDPVPIASMTKMMTLLLTFEDLESRNDISLSTPIKVTMATQRIGGSQVYLDNRETFPLGELMKTVAIKSANDSAYLISEFLSNKDVPAFVARMNRRARALHMPSTKFVNSCGLPNKDGHNSMSSPEGMALLAEQLLLYPQLRKWTTTFHAYFRPEGDKARQLLTNTNKLIKTCPGVDGMKTGYIRAAGYCITVTCKRGGRRLVAVVTGFKTSKERNDFVAKLLDWGYRRAAELAAHDKNSVMTALANTKVKNVESPKK
ncbi:D-alanyl-D-alanine carboxypeptidase [Lentisphaerota bacterium ZTH]|nr:D-alanyl-D-alanine carboxypeptidase [Lentisphaerota bacterium]WET05765.1 D-alanyl-D-alanine carboxypeptidase [Lentisphaerota bacterium ZTH]